MTAPMTKSIPSWAWIVMVLVLVGLALSLALKDRQTEPTPALLYDVAEYEVTDPEQLLFEEAGRIGFGDAKAGGLAVDAAGSIYVAVSDSLRVYNNAGELQRELPIPGTPNCMTVSKENKIYLGYEKKVIVLDQAGATIFTLPELKGNAFITSIAVQGDSIFIADAGNKEVVHYTHDGSLVSRFGQKDTAKEIPGLVVPSPYLDVAIDRDDKLWVVNPGKHGLENFLPDGELADAWYRSSMTPEGFCGCCNPIHIAFREDGAMVTMEKGLNRAKLYGPDRVFMGYIAGPESFKSKHGPGFAPLETAFGDLAVDGQGRVLILDTMQKAVRIFQPKEAQ